MVKTYQKNYFRDTGYVHGSTGQRPISDARRYISSWERGLESAFLNWANAQPKTTRVQRDYIYMTFHPDEDRRATKTAAIKKASGGIDETPNSTRSVPVCEDPECTMCEPYRNSA